MVIYINRIIWRFIEHKPDQYKSLDIRHNVMKNLILGDCNHLIKFILFGNKEDNNKDDKNEGKKNEEFKMHIPRSKFWKKKHKYTKDDDIVPIDKEKMIPDKKKPKNDMELAIYHCRSKL